MERHKLTAAIDQAVEGLIEELVSFASTIFAIPTQNPPGNNYLQCARVIGAMMERIGMDVEYIEVPQERLAELAPLGEGLPRVSVIGYLGDKNRRPNIHFTGHYDVVPEGTGWTTSPYGCEIRDGKIYARGSADQKSGIVSELIAAYALQKAGLKLKGTFIASATPDEETGGQAGVGYLVEQGYLTQESTDYCVITECLDVDKVCIGHRGTLWFEVHITGRQSHGSMPNEGVNALEFAQRLMSAIDEDIRPLPGDIQGLAQPDGVVPHHRVPEDVDSQGGQSLGDLLSVGIGDAAQQQFGADGDDLSSMRHERTFFPSRLRQDLTRTQVSPSKARATSASTSRAASASRTSSSRGRMAGCRGVKTVQQSS